MTFHNPLWLIAALCIAGGFAWFLRVVAQRDARQAHAFSELALADRAFGSALWLERGIFALLVLGVACAAAAPAGPQLIVKVPDKTGSIMLCIDTSGSMASDDIEPTRAIAANKAAHMFVDHLPQGVKVGIVSFSTFPNPVLTPDSSPESINAAIDRIPAPNGATGIGDALALSEQLLPAKGRRAVVLLTDGINNRGTDPVEVSTEMGRKHITLYTVGIGQKDSGHIIPGTNEAADSDPDALRTYAELTGGKFFAVSDANAISAAFLALSQETTWQSRVFDLSMPLALAGAAILTLGVLAGLAAGKFPAL